MIFFITDCRGLPTLRGMSHSHLSFLHFYVSAKHPLTDPSGHLSPCPGERKRSVGFAPGLRHSSEIASARFLSPGQGERWLATRDGEGVLRAALKSRKIRPPAMQEMSEADSLLRGRRARASNLSMRAAR